MYIELTLFDYHRQCLIQNNAQRLRQLDASQLSSSAFFAHQQYDKMVRLFLNIWPFATMKISPIMSQICQTILSNLPNKK